LDEEKFKQIIDYIVIEPRDPTTKDESYKFPFVCNEILGSQSNLVINHFFPSQLKKSNSTGSMVCVDTEIEYKFPEMETNPDNLESQVVNNKDDDKKDDDAFFENIQRVDSIENNSDDILNSIQRIDTSEEQTEDNLRFDSEEKNEDDDDLVINKIDSSNGVDDQEKEWVDGELVIKKVDSTEDDKSQDNKVEGCEDIVGKTTEENQQDELGFSGKTVESLEVEESELPNLLSPPKVNNFITSTGSTISADLEELKNLNFEDDNNEKTDQIENDQEKSVKKQEEKPIFNKSTLDHLFRFVNHDGVVNEVQAGYFKNIIESMVNCKGREFYLYFYEQEDMIDNYLKH